MPALFVDAGFHLLPDSHEVLYFFHTTSVAVVHLFEDCAATLKSVGPGNAVEPQQVSLRTAVDVIVDRAIGFTILCRGVRTCVCTVETNAVLVGLVVVDRTPLDGIFCDKAIRLRSIVLIESEDMV